MSRGVLVALLVSACGSPGAAHDAVPDTPPDARTSCPSVPSDYPPTCATTCGNGVVDDCTTPHLGGEHCTTYTHGLELCDGADLHTTCADVGYYGGTPACSSHCTFDDRGCDVCAVACTAIAGGFTSIAAVSGTHLGIVHEATLTGGYAFTILDSGLTETASTPIDQVYAITGVPDGWLLVNGSLAVRHVDTNGTLGPSIQVATTGGTATSLVFGPGGHALLLWNEVVAPDMPRVNAAVLAADGTVVVAPFVLFDETTLPEIATATTDGTSFFVAAKGRLVRLAADGTAAPIVTGYPTEGPHLLGAAVQLGWSGSAGWYIVPNDALEQSYTAQRFDATGAAAGAPFTITTSTRVTSLRAYGTGLVGSSLQQVTTSLWRFAVVAIDATGAQVSSTEVGVTGETSPIIEPFGGGVAASWYGAGHEAVALATP
jgi:hypothetical protein